MRLLLLLLQHRQQHLVAQHCEKWCCTHRLAQRSSRFASQTKIPLRPVGSNHNTYVKICGAISWKIQIASITRVGTMSRTQGSPVLLRHEFRRVVLQELHLSDQLLQQGHVSVLVQIDLQRHLSLASSQQQKGTKRFQQNLEPKSHGWPLISVPTDNCVQGRPLVTPRLSPAPMTSRSKSILECRAGSCYAVTQLIFWFVYSSVWNKEMLDSTIHAGWNKPHLKNLPLSSANPCYAVAMATPYKALWLPKNCNQDY